MGAMFGLLCVAAFALCAASPAAAATLPPNVGAQGHEQAFGKSDPIHTGVFVIASNQGGFPSGFLDADDYFGTAIGRLGDLNDDGITDLVIGTPFDDDAGSNAGAVYVLEMATQTTVSSAFKITEGLRGFSGDLSVSDHAGYSVDGVGDLDGNGVMDIAMGAIGDDTAGDSAGAAYVMLMGSNVQVTSTVKITTGQGGFAQTLSAGDHFGSGVAGIGDVDDNGVPDIAIGADLSASGGAVYVMRMLATGQVSSSTKIASATGGLSSALVAGDQFGWRVAALGDVNGDSVPDIAVGAPNTERGGETGAGSVYILHLTSSGSVSNDYEITTNTSGFNHTLAASGTFGSPGRIGDVDGDGVDDLAVGAEGSNSVFVLLMDGDGLVKDHHHISSIDTGYFGRGVSFVERGPGVSLLVGAPAASVGGKVYVVDLVDRSPTPTPSPSASATPSATPSPTPSAKDDDDDNMGLIVIVACAAGGVLVLAAVCLAFACRGKCSKPAEDTVVDSNKQQDVQLAETTLPKGTDAGDIRT